MRGGRWLGTVLGAGALAIAGTACTDAGDSVAARGSRTDLNKPERGQTEGSPSMPEQSAKKDSKVAPPAGAFKPTRGQDKTAAAQEEPPNLDMNGAQATQVGQPATGDQPGALAGPAAQQDTAAGGTPGAEIVVDGHLVESSSDALLIDAPNKHGLRVKIDSQTKFSLDGKKSSAANLIEGAEVRAAYKLKDGEPVGTRIDGTSNLGKLHPAEQMKRP